MLRFLTAGESHGQALLVVIEGLPAGLAVDLGALDAQLRRRQRGYGRGQRMQIEADRAEVVSGVRHGETIGSPVGVLIRNQDWKNWQATMAVAATPDRGKPAVRRPRPGHADLAGGLKYERRDLRDVLERASARETAARVAAGAFVRQMLGAVGIEVMSHVVAVGDVAVDAERVISPSEVRAIPEDSQVRVVDPVVERRMIEVIDRAKQTGDTLGGIFEVIATGVPPGLGSYAQWDRRLDGLLAQGLMSIPAIKAVAIGAGVANATRPGSQVHDEIVVSGAPPDQAITRSTNRAGGLEGGVTNGEDVRVTAYMKPIATLMKPLRSVDLDSMSESPATIERSDVCAVPAAAVVGEAMVAVVLGTALLDRFGGDSMEQLRAGIAAGSVRAGRLTGP